MRIKVEKVKGLCFAARCEAPSTVIDATGRVAPERLELCDHHWEVRCEELGPPELAELLDLDREVKHDA